VEMTARVKTLLVMPVAGKKPDDHVFTRGARNRPVRSFRKAWRNLCVKCGLGAWEGKKYRGLIVHDLRRSGAKALRRAGVPESVIMAVGGWKTSAMFRRYAIVSTADQRDAVKALERAREVNSPRSAPFGENPVPPGSGERAVKLHERLELSTTGA
jgi:integrase